MKLSTDTRISADDWRNDLQWLEAEKYANNALANLNLAITGKGTLYFHDK